MITTKADLLVIAGHCAVHNSVITPPKISIDLSPTPSAAA